MLRNRTAKAFEETITKEKLNKRVADNIKEMDYQIMGVGTSRSFIKWIYGNKPGTVSDPVSIGDQYVVALITGEKKEGVQSAAEARIMVEPTVRNKKKAALLSAKFGKYANLEEAAKNIGQEVSAVDSIRFSDNFKPGFGNELILIGAAFNKGYQEKVSSPLFGNTGVYAVRKSLGALPNDAANVDSSVRLRLRNKEANGWALGNAGIKRCRNNKRHPFESGLLIIT